MKRLILIDSHAVIHRAFHALPPLTSPAGEPVGARRRVRALFAGLVIVHAFVLARLATSVILGPVLLPVTFWTNAFRKLLFGYFRALFFKRAMLRVVISSTISCSFP